MVSEKVSLHGRKFPFLGHTQKLTPSGWNIKIWKGKLIMIGNNIRQYYWNSEVGKLSKIWLYIINTKKKNRYLLQQNYRYFNQRASWEK